MEFETREISDRMIAFTAETAQKTEEVLRAEAKVMKLDLTQRVNYNER